MISHDYRCIFIHIPKCAGSSIERALGHAEHGPSYPDHRSIRMLEPLGWPALATPGNLFQLALRVRHDVKPSRNPLNKLKLTRAQYASYFKFSIVRNPWARAFSWYANCVNEPLLRRELNVDPAMPFADFLRERVGRGALRPQLAWLRDARGALPLDFIGRFETLHRDFAAVCARLGRPAPLLPHARKGSGADYREHYDKSTRALVAAAYAEEIELFGYAFDDFADTPIVSDRRGKEHPATSLDTGVLAASLTRRDAEPR